MIKEEVARRERLQNLTDSNINPYPASAKRTHMASEVMDKFETLEKSNDHISIAGRVRAIRKHGGLTFVVIEDTSGTFQAVLHRDVIGTEKYDQFGVQADVGDFYSVSGPSFRTKRGEPSIDAQEYQLLTKSLLPLPEKWHGLTDTEKRYRHRYLDLISNPSAMEIAKTRSRMVAAIRRFLESEGFMEVETPVLQALAGGANAKPFVTHHNTLDHDFYLRIAPELFLKRLIVGGFEKIYEFARCYRNEGISPQHNPEFTQIELYWAYAEIEDLMDHLERMMSQVVKETIGSSVIQLDNLELKFETPFPRTSFHDVVEAKTGIDLDQISGEEALRELMIAKKIDVRGVVGEGELIDTLYKHAVRPQIIQPTFVTDYPVAMKPLAKVRENNPKYSASAQLVVNGLEVWNAFNELNDPLEQEARFNEQESLRERGSEDAQRVDFDFLKALKHGMPPTAGYGLGIDRLAMILTGSPNLKEVILFPTLKPLADGAEDEEETAE
ncbi:lysine--tRNA ligase [Candidatus Uhrbacteria bacterium CG_4_9_14_3_um_filter_41_35]|uniref:Lysine--tRNA ligase n=1 Tax=Candidatus Uhrbacteria bacterium CG_4_9_14_3_um_filter_41_35 TaxID=1975034 RepID=A0A2M7XF98_9BACT|nr:MAG: lysine--tRNA ligase [Candidatus Uhrbacteria bacterium CG11_big_fil_rev_8_21_14_0_20_41_9]PJA46550.1 MAG: lysine--tRNA ligase [Candidatus Uhrbacteria bacterium CG_4_9_14_3_um_filter_41_35]